MRESNRVTQSGLYFDDNNRFIFGLVKNAFVNDDMLKYIDHIPNKVKNKAGNSRRAVPIENKEASKGSLRSGKSNILGYFDRPKPRPTAFLKNHPTEWGEFLPVVRYINDLYKHYFPDQYKEQAELIKKVPAEFRIDKTIFTTITINKDFQTPPHTDAGNIGFSLMVVAGNGYEGGYLKFPEHDIVVECKPGDLVIMSPDEVHTNTKIDLLTKQGTRYSLVFYIRKGFIAK